MERAFQYKEVADWISEDVLMDETHQLDDLALGEVVPPLRLPYRKKDHAMNWRRPTSAGSG